MSTPVLTVFAEKGGVGKTSVVLNLAGCFAERKQRVLVVDTDKQANLSKTLMDEKTVLELHKLNTVAALFDPELEPEAEHVIHPTGVENVHLIPANRALKEHLQPPTEVLDVTQWAVRDFLFSVAGAFDIILIDTCPDIDVLPTWGSLLAATHVMTPVEPERFSGQSLHGVSLQLQAAQQRRGDIQFLGYVVNKRDSRRALHKSYEKHLRGLYGPQVFDTVIRLLGAFAESQHFGKPVVQYDKKCDAAKIARSLAEEVLARTGRRGDAGKTNRKKRKAA